MAGSIASFTAPSPAAAKAEPTKIALDAYLQIHDALAQDRVEGIAASAKTIAAQSKSFGANLQKQISAQASTLASAKDLAAARDAFKGLSEVLSRWATESKRTDVAVFRCSMANASWLQRADQSAIRNPYYGSEMLACGERVSR